EADAGFAAKNRQAADDLIKSHADLRSRLADVQGQLDTARVEGIRKIDRALTEDRAARLAGLETELLSIRQRAEKETTDMLQRGRAALERERTEHDGALAKERERLDSERRAFREEAARERAALDERDKRLHVELS